MSGTPEETDENVGAYTDTESPLQKRFQMGAAEASVHMRERIEVGVQCPCVYRYISETFQGQL